MNQYNSFPSLNSDRFIFRKISKNDVNEIFFLRSDPASNMFIERELQKDISEAAVWIDNLIPQINENTCYHWVITSETSNTMMGSICLWNFSEDRKTAELGYDLLPAFRKQGVMNEAVGKIISFAFGSIHLDAIEAFTHQNNHPSIQLLDRNKFRLQKERTDPGFPDNLIFRIEKRDYRVMMG